MAESDLLISLDKLPIKRIDAIEESGIERFPPDLSYDEKTVNLIRRIDFTWAVERDAKKQKKTKAKESSGSSMLQGLIENLQLARQEIQVIVDLIATVEANDAVAVAVMNRPKPLPNEALSDLAVSTATKLQCYRHLGKYFKQSAKSLEHQIAREARFYGALIRLQKNWKVKRHRLAANAPGSEGFLIDLSDNSMHESAILTRPPAFSMVRVDHDSSGMLAVNIPKSSCRSFRFGFLDVQSGKHLEESEEMDFIGAEESPKETVKDSLSDDDRVRETNTVLCDAHRAIFYELVFGLISRESFNPSLGFSVTGIRENYLELSLKPGVSAFISLEPYDTQDHAGKGKDAAQGAHEVSYGASLMEVKRDKNIEPGRPNHTTYEIYLEQLFHSEIFSKGKPQPTLPGKAQPVVQTKDDEGLVTHFCLSLSHRIFSSKVLMELESLVTKVPYLQLITQPTWHSRTSSWTLFVKVPESILDARSQACRSDDLQLKKSLFQTRVVVKDDSISIEGGGAPNVVGLFKGDLEAMSSKGRFNCDLVDLPMVLLLQVASQIISWLHEEASIVGIKTNLDFLSLSWELDQGETLSLIAHVDPEDPLGCISWWLILDDSPTEDRKFPAELADGDSSTRRFLGYLALDTLYSTLMDLVSVCTGSVSH